MDNKQINQSNNSSSDQNNTNQAPQQPAGGQHNNNEGSKKNVVTLAVIVALLAGFGGGVLAADTTGFSLLGQETSEQHEEATETDGQDGHSGSTLEVPDDAQVINECAARRGKQFVKPEDIPFGPVYGVWEDEITSVEYMLGKEDFLGGTDYNDVDLMGAEYDHMDVGLLSEGHAGYPEPHYHVDLFTISQEESEQITCE